MSVRARDGARFQLDVSASPALGEDAPIVLMLPAMGVEGRFYNRLAAPWAARGYRLVTADLRGHGHSDVRPWRSADFGFATVVERDLPAMVEAVASRYPQAARIVMGHSLGGQLAALYTATQPEDVPPVDAMVAVASCSVHWSGYPPIAQPGIALGTQLAAVVAMAWGSFPGHRLGFAGHESRGVILDWARQARTGRYALGFTDVDYEAALATSKVPALFLSLSGDRLAPSAAVRNLAFKLPPATTTASHVQDGPISRQRRPHFDWVKVPDAVLDRAAAWLSERQAKAANT